LIQIFEHDGIEYEIEKIKKNHNPTLDIYDVVFTLICFIDEGVLEDTSFINIWIVIVGNQLKNPPPSFGHPASGGQIKCKLLRKMFIVLFSIHILRHNSWSNLF